MRDQFDDDASRDDPIAMIAARLREPVAMNPAARERVMRAVRASPAPQRRGAFVQWLLRPRMVAVRPAGALAAAAVVLIAAGMMVRGARVERRGENVTPAIASRPSAQVVQFVLVARAASSVSLVGDFNAWDGSSTPLRVAKDGVWSVSITLPPGRHEYAFLVNGHEWTPDPAAASAPADEFGSRNSVVLVGPGGA